MHSATHLLHRVVADSREEPIEDGLLQTPCRTLTEREPQKGERGVLIRVLSPILLAVDDPGLGGMQPRPRLSLPAPAPPTHIPDLIIRKAMGHKAGAVPFERY